jgi:hypothetical protein
MPGGGKLRALFFITNFEFNNQGDISFNAGLDTDADPGGNNDAVCMFSQMVT